MKVIVIGREETDYGREMREWRRDFERSTQIEPELISPDSPEGERFCRARDIMRYPTVAVVEEDMGRVIGMWSGTPFPPIDEVAYAARS